MSKLSGDPFWNQNTVADSVVILVMLNIEGLGQSCAFEVKVKKKKTNVTASHLQSGSIPKWISSGRAVIVFFEKLFNILLNNRCLNGLSGLIF